MTTSLAFRKSFGARLRQLRATRHLSQEALAGEIGNEPRCVSRYERGVTLPNAATLVQLARVLRVSVGKLLLGEEDDERAAAATQIRDHVLLDRFREAERLPPNDRAMIVAIIDALIASRTGEADR